MLYYNDNKATAGNVNGRDPYLAVLSAVAKKNGKRLNERKSASLKLAKIYYSWAEKEENENLALMLKKRAGRIIGCCDNREICVDPEKYCFTLSTSRCRDRNCQECQRVRAFVYQEKIRSITSELVERTDKTDGFIFGTLTIKNPHITQLKKTLKIMSRALTRLLARKKIKSVIRGGFRCFEVTRGKIEDHCHPHIHFLIQIQKKYFNTKGAHFMSESEWAEEWTRCLEKECEIAGVDFNRADYPNERAFVKILRIQTPYSLKNAGKIDEKTGKKIKKVYTTIFDLKDGSDNVINYVLKYTSKNDNLIADDSWFKIFDAQIKGIRSISFFGIYKDLVGEIPAFEYDEEETKKQIYHRVNEDMGEKVEDLKFYTAKWCDDHKYITIEQTMSEALEKKRFNIVDTMRRTLKVQTENLYKHINFITEKLKDEKFNNSFIVDESIIECNKLKNRIIKTLKRIEKAGSSFEDLYGFKINKMMIDDFERILDVELFNELKNKRDQQIQENIDKVRALNSIDEFKKFLNRIML